MNPEGIIIAILLPTTAIAGAQSDRINQSPLRKESIPASNLAALFQLCNERYFDSAIKPSSGFKLRFSRSVRLSGCFTFALDTHVDWAIYISARLRAHPMAALSTMAHEMIHMLAHQRFRETGDAFYLDQAPLAGHPFVNKDHGAFFLSELDRLNRSFPELQIDVKSTFGDSLYEAGKITPARLLLVMIDESLGRGMVYRLHDKATNDWSTLRATARKMHGVERVKLIEVAGQRAEGFPMLKMNNEPRANMVPVRLKGFAEKTAAMLSATGTRVLQEPASVTRIPARPVLRSNRHGEVHRRQRPAGVA